MRNNELINILRDVETLFRSDDWRHVRPEVVAEILVMARHAIEQQPVSTVRQSDPSTSRKAGKSAAMRSGSQRHRLLSMYANSDGLTDEQAGLQAGLAQPGVCYWKRCSELREYGYIQPLGFTRLASTGEQQMVCGITDTGRVAVERLAVARAG